MHAVARCLFIAVNHIRRGKEIFDNADAELWSKRGYDLVHPADLHHYAAAHQHCTIHFTESLFSI